MIKKKSTLMSRRKTAIIVAAILTALLVVALIFVLDYVNATSVEDPADGTVYYVREKKNVYSLYDTDKKTLMPTEEQYGYYVTHAGTLVEVDAETGEYEIKAVVDTEGNEQLGINQRILMFPHLEKKDILKLEVHNSEGTFTFARYDISADKESASADFVLMNSPISTYDQEKFASLHVSAGYTITTRKIVNPIKDANGEFSEYGLVSETRTREKTDEDGEFLLDEQGGYIYEEYEYVPAYYVITDINGNAYKVIVGDRLVTGGGYYVQYVEVDGENETKRDAVYVLDDTFGDTLLAPVEDFVTPQISYPMTMNTYTNVDDFVILKRNPNSTGKDDKYSAVVKFYFVPLDQRETEITVHTPYFFTKGSELEGYTVSSDNANTALYSLYQPSFGGVVKLSPDMEDFAKYGLATEVGTDKDGKPEYELTPEYMISFDYEATVDDESFIVNNHILVSKRTEDGKYYVFTQVSGIDENGDIDDDATIDYNAIVEVEGHSLEFLNWDKYDWINDQYIHLNIAFADKITLEDHTTGYKASFDLDNSESDMSEKVSSDKLTVHATDSNGNDTNTFSQMTVRDKSGNKWVITSSEIKCYSSSGSELKIKSASYSYNKLGKQVRIISGEIECDDGRRIEVKEDTIVIKSGGGDTVIVRYHTELFRDYFQTLIYASITDTYDMSKEDEEKLLSDESKLLVTLTVTDTEGGENVYKFYRLTSRKAYITVNGKGGFYVLSNRVEKFVTDAQRFFANEIITPTSKY